MIHCFRTWTETPSLLVLETNWCYVITENHFKAWNVRIGKYCILNPETCTVRKKVKCTLHYRIVVEHYLYMPHLDPALFDPTNPYVWTLNPAKCNLSFLLTPLSYSTCTLLLYRWFRITLFLGTGEIYGPTAQHMQDCPIFFIQLNHVHK